MREVGILAVGCVTPLGEHPPSLWAALCAGVTTLSPQPNLAALIDPRAAVVPGPDLTRWLARRKDLRLLPRAARLALPAAGRAMEGYDGDREELGIYVAIGREPPDEGECEPALAAMENHRHLDLTRLGNEGRALYPPLLPLRTLPNMVLAHVAIQHGIRGENGTYAGGAAAGRQALEEGVRAVVEGRAPFALVGAAYSGVDLASARDRLRMGDPDPPGEAAIFALIGPGGRPVPQGSVDRRWRVALGDVGPVEGMLGLLEG